MRAREPLFLAREGYRRRRVMDAARILPVVGGVLFAFPMLWPAEAETGEVLIYLICAWLVLIASAWALGRVLSPLDKGDGGDG